MSGAPELETLTLVVAAVGGFVGRTTVHPEVEAAAVAPLAAASGELLDDACVCTVGDHLALLLSHRSGPDAAAVHALAWEALAAAAAAARALGQHEPGRDLLADTFPGSLRAAGPGVAELALLGRPSEPVVLLLADRAGAGAFNLPLLRAFADPFTTAGLVTEEPLRRGFAFEVHDTAQRRKAMLTAPEELADLIGLAAASDRFLLRRIVTRDTGDVAVAVAADGRRDAGLAPGDRAAALVRCGGAFPAVGEVTAPFAQPWPVRGPLGGARLGALAPVPRTAAAAGPGDGPPRAVALGFQVAAGRLVGPLDLFADAAFDAARREAAALDALLARGGVGGGMGSGGASGAVDAAIERLDGRWATHEGV